MATAAESIIDYSQTQRVVLLIDLNPLLHLQNPTPYLTSLLAATKPLISFPPLSSSLFAFKPFLSSLSPVLSCSKLPSPSVSLSFNLPDLTFQSLSQTLTSLPSLYNPSANSTARVVNVAASMRQIFHDYGWDPLVCDPVTGMFVNRDCDSVFVRSNLVVLFSPICRSAKCLSEFLEVELEDECVRNVDAFIAKFRGCFESVNEKFVSTDIHCSWVDVEYEPKCGLENSVIHGSESGSGFFASATKSLGWGFCSTNSIILGSALVPFGLIYPKIGVSSNFINCDSCCEKLHANLSLEILDVSGKPLECKGCELELISLKAVPRNRCGNLLFNPEFVNLKMRVSERNENFWGSFADGFTKVRVISVQGYSKGVKFDGLLSNLILVREFLEESGTDKRDGYSEFYADRVLEMLAVEMGEFVQRKSLPTWQIILNFLYREGYWALVSLSNGNDNSYMGVLFPFTVSSALLSVLDDGFFLQSIVYDFSGANLTQFATRMDNEMGKEEIELSKSDRFIGTQSLPSTCFKHTACEGGKRKKKRKNLHLVKDLTWSAYCEAAFEHSEIRLEDVYLVRGCSSSKKLKFLKCWMKQIRKSSFHSLTMTDRSKPHQDIPKVNNKLEEDDGLTEFPQECEQPIPSCASAAEDSLTEASRIQDDTALDFHSETSESFFSNLPSKIQQGLESEDIELGALAERLVNSSIFWLYQTQEMEKTSVSQAHVAKFDEAHGFAFELMKLLLGEPKDLAGKHKNNDPCSQISDVGSPGFTSNQIIRDYELQILFRMELLRSEVGPTIGESTKQKFVKQICSFFETIQCHMEGGFFGDWSLDTYVAKIIKNRYCHTLGDVVHRIYTKMDLLLFGDQDESSNPLFNSEDSNPAQPEKGNDCRTNEPVSAEDESLHPLENTYGSRQVMSRQEHARKLAEARERRERARRFASFTSWVPDLQRVWAPKQPKGMKPKSDPQMKKLSKRKGRRRISCDMVCETPMTGKKRSYPRGSNVDDSDHQDCPTSLCGSVSKALFQDDR